MLFDFSKTLHVLNVHKNRPWRNIFDKGFNHRLSTILLEHVDFGKQLSGIKVMMIVTIDSHKWFTARFLLYEIFA